MDADVEVCQVEEAVRRFEQITGRRPRILIAKMGQDGHDRWVGGVGARVGVGIAAGRECFSQPAAVVVLMNPSREGCGDCCCGSTCACTCGPVCRMHMSTLLRGVTACNTPHNWSL